jgi:predicted dehydrogenase
VTTDKKFRWGLIGYGDLAGKRVADALRTALGSELRGVWGRDLERTRSFAARHEIPEAHCSLASLLASEIDGVYVCTPPDSHAAYTIEAIDAGRHVLVEKPMATTTADCVQMVRRTAERGRTLGVAYYRRAFSAFRRIKELIEGGILGTPTWVNIAFHSWYNPAADDPKHWRVERKRSGGGGALADVGTHRFDLLDYWLGPTQLAFRDLHRCVHKYEVEDGASLVLKLANGAPVHAYFAWSSSTFMDRFEIAGSQGKILIDPLDGPVYSVLRGRDREDFRPDVPANVHRPCVEDFVEAVRAHRAPLCDGDAGLRTTALLEQIVAGGVP